MKKIITIAFISIFTHPLFSQFSEEDYYAIITLPMPEGEVVEAAGLATFPDGRVAVATRRGAVYIINNVTMPNQSRVHVTKFADGLNEILGLAYKDGYLYCAQRSEITKLIDSNKDGIADIYEATAKWPLSGHYHEYSFGPKVDKDGNFIVTFNLGFNGAEGKWYEATSDAPFRGWMLKIYPDGTLEPWSVGHRSPCGLFVHPITNEYFYTENQGDWIGSGGITHCEKGDFVGNPAGLQWTNQPNSPLKLSFDEFCRITKMCSKNTTLGINIPIEEVPDIGEPIWETKKRIPQLKPQAVTLPHGIMGQSTSDIIYLHEGNGIAPHFTGQMLVGDQFASKIMRFTLEKVKGVYQGAAFDFRKDFASGILRFTYANDGSLIVGMSNRGWGSIGKSPWAVQRMAWSGKVPFEIYDIKAMPDGFEIEFLEPVKKESATNPINYEITSFTYKYHSRYGSPTINEQKHTVKAAVLSADSKKVRIVVDGLREGYVFEVRTKNITSANNTAELLHPVGYYTLNRIPDGEKLTVTAAMMHTHHQHMSAKPAAKPAAQATKPAATAPKPSTAKAEAASAKNMTKQPASWANGPDKTINLGTRPGLMYDQAKINVKAGQKIKLSFVNNDDMQHNVVITKPGKADAVGETATNMGLEGPKLHYVPKSDDVLFHTKLVNPGSSEVIYFEAPSTPGTYQIVCTYPGHYATMQSVLIVTP